MRGLRPPAPLEPAGDPCRPCPNCWQFPSSFWLLGSLSREVDYGGGVFPSSSAHPPISRLCNRHRKWPHQALERQCMVRRQLGHKRGTWRWWGPSPLGGRSPASRARSQLPRGGGGVRVAKPAGTEVRGQGGPGSDVCGREKLSQSRQGVVDLCSPCSPPVAPLPRAPQGYQLGQRPFPSRAL